MTTEPINYKAQDDLIKQLEAIYRLIQEVECHHCHQCCGPIIWFQPEEINIQHYLNHFQILPRAWTNQEFEEHENRCPYIQNHRCLIYPVRPIVCRLQGVIPELPCHRRSHFESSYIDDEFIRRRFFRFLRDWKMNQVFFSTRRYSPSSYLIMQTSSEYMLKKIFVESK